VLARIVLAFLVCSLFVGVLPAANTLGVAYTPSTDTSVMLSCIRGSACTTSSVALSDTGTDFFTIDAPSASWLGVTPMSGTASSTPTTITFTVSPAWTTLGTGVFNATVTIRAGALTPVAVPVVLQISDPAASLSVLGTINVLNTATWTIGSAVPQLSITVFSSTAVPIPYSATASCNPTSSSGLTNWLTIAANRSSGIAYSWGATIPLTLAPLAFQQAQFGDTLSGSVVIAAAGQTLTVPVNITAVAGQPTITSLFPTAVPVMISPGSPGTVTLVINGTGFVTSASQQTKVFVGAAAVPAANVTVLSSNTMTALIPYASDGTPFNRAGSVTMGVANGANPTAPATGGTKALTVTAAPIITTVTSASTWLQPATGANPTVAPYDIISIFGYNFCPLCTGANAVLVASPDPVYFRYPSFLSPDGSHKVTVTFSKATGSGWVATGYLLFASNNQLNVLVPASIASQTPSLLGAGTVKVSVGYDTAVTASAANSSAGYILNAAAVDPGIFTLDANGQGAVLSAGYVLNSASAPATQGNGSVVLIYGTGLGIPTGTAPNTTNLTAPPTSCIAPIGAAGSLSADPTGYMGTVFTGIAHPGGYTPPTGYVAPSTSWNGSIDGAVIRSVLLSSGVFPPCLATLPTVTIAGQPAVVNYAGFVSDSVAGLYQLNVVVPTINLTTLGLTAPAQVPVLITFPGTPAVSSQAGVYLWVQ
jgi:uncharacterized protein (TIGR03437 family)